MVRRSLVVGIVALAAVLVVAPALVAAAADLSVAPESGEVGTVVAASGAGYTSGRTCSLHLTDGPIPTDASAPVGSCTVGAAGLLTGSLTIPARPSGPAVVWACNAHGGANCGSASTERASASFLVTDPPTTTTTTSTTTTSTTTTTTRPPVPTTLPPTTVTSVVPTSSTSPSTTAGLTPPTTAPAPATTAPSRPGPPPAAPTTLAPAATLPEAGAAETESAGTAVVSGVTLVAPASDAESAVTTAVLALDEPLGSGLSWDWLPPLAVAAVMLAATARRGRPVAPIVGTVPVPRRRPESGRIRHRRRGGLATGWIRHPFADPGEDSPGKHRR